VQLKNRNGRPLAFLGIADLQIDLSYLADAIAMQTHRDTKAMARAKLKLL